MSEDFDERAASALDASRSQLKAAMKEAERALAADPTEANLARLRDIRANLADLGVVAPTLSKEERKERLERSRAYYARNPPRSPTILDALAILCEAHIKDIDAPNWSVEMPLHPAGFFDHTRYILAWGAMRHHLLAFRRDYVELGDEPTASDVLVEGDRVIDARERFGKGGK